MANGIVLFEARIKKGKMEDDLARAGQVKEFLKQTPGFIWAEHFSSIATEKELLRMYIWKNEESVLKSRNFLAHRQSQQQGRMETFVDYKITVVTPVRCYSMNGRDEAPADANLFFGMEV